MSFYPQEKDGLAEKDSTLYTLKHSAFPPRKLPLKKLGAGAGSLTAVVASVIFAVTATPGVGGTLEAVPAPTTATNATTADDTHKITTPTSGPYYLSLEEAVKANLARGEQASLTPQAKVEDLRKEKPTQVSRQGRLTAPITTAPPAPEAIAPGDRLAWPVKNHGLSSNFGPRSDPFTREQRFHTGLDMGGACGTPIYASETGVVEAAGNTYGSYGNRVVVKHRPDLSTAYSHLQEIKVKTGDEVVKGYLIGLMGTTGRSTGCHLHFEVIKDGHYVSPWSWLTGKPDSVKLKVLVGSTFSAGRPSAKSTEKPEVPASKTTSKPKTTPPPTPSATPTPTPTPRKTPPNPTPKPTPSAPTSTPTSTPTPTPTSSAPAPIAPSSPPPSAPPTSTTPAPSTSTTKPSEATPTTSKVSAPPASSEAAPNGALGSESAPGETL